MAKQNLNFYYRKTHRYLGIFIGIQFLFWTIGGLYFSWNNLDEIHGDHLMDSVQFLSPNHNLASPAISLKTLGEKEELDSLVSVQLIRVLGKPNYQISFIKNGEKRAQLADALSGELRPPISEAEAIEMAQAKFLPDAPVLKAELLTAQDVDKLHEYRKRPLPVWAVSFDHSSNATVYVDAQWGTVERVRHTRWRIFDFLWMLHTMDYESKDHFGNKLLQSFSVLGLITVFSGFILFYRTSPTVRKVKKKFQAKSNNKPSKS